jgi:hypothetical protein
MIWILRKIKVQTPRGHDHKFPIRASRFGFQARCIPDIILGHPRRVENLGNVLTCRSTSNCGFRTGPKLCYLGLKLCGRDGLSAKTQDNWYQFSIRWSQQSILQREAFRTGGPQDSFGVTFSFQG